MKTPIALFAILLTIITACNWDKPHAQRPDVTKDTLAYKYEVFKQRADDCGNKPDSGCTVINIKYPRFSGEPELNDTIEHRVTTLFQISEDEGRSLPALAKQFMDTYRKGRRVPPVPYTLLTQAKVVRQDSDLVTIEISGYNFMGGAHGSSITTFINWNTATKRNVTLGDILTAGHEKPLTGIAEKIFRKDEKLSDTASLKTNYFFTGGVFSLNHNFLITPVGLRFLYNQYEIKPYAAGQTNLVIPYSQIKSLLKPHTVVSQYHK